MLQKFASVKATLALLGMTLTGIAEAGVTAGAGFGVGQFDYEDVENGSARTFYLGYEFDRSPVYFEIAKVDTGDADVTSIPGVTLNVSGFTFGVGYRAVLDPATGSGIYFKGGRYTCDAEASDGASSATKRGSGVFLGMGGDLMFAPSFGLRFDVEGLFAVKDFAEDKNVTVLTVGPIVKF